MRIQEVPRALQRVSGGDHWISWTLRLIQFQGAFQDISRDTRRSQERFKRHPGSVNGVPRSFKKLQEITRALKEVSRAFQGVSKGL